MAQFINNIKTGWTATPNAIINNKKITAKAKGIWTYLASKPTGWQFSSERIAEDFADGRDSIRAGLRELEAIGLLKRITANADAGKFETRYEIRTRTDDGKSGDGKSADGKPDAGKAGDIIIKNNKQRNSNKEITNIMSAPAKPAPTRQIPKEAYQLADRLYKWIIKNKPDRKIQTGWRDRWAEDIDKMHRIDGREWRRIAGAIDWSQRDDFWHQNILSGANLRKHYDRIEERAIIEMEDNGSQALASAVFNQTPDQAIATARAQGLI